MKIDIKHLDRDSRAPLWHRYPGQFQPQWAYLEISPEEPFVSLDTTGEIGNAVPMAVWHNRVLRVDVPANLSWDEIDRLVEGQQVATLIEQIIEGHSVHWDGSNQVGCLTDDAREALDTLQEYLLGEYQGETEIWSTEEWLENSTCFNNGEYRIENVGRVTCESTDEELSGMAERIRLNADVENIFLEDDPEDWLQEIRKQLIQEAK